MNLLAGRGARLASYIILAIAASQSLFPIALALVNSLKTTLQITQDPLARPLAPQWVNYANAWNHAHLGRALLTSALISGLTIILVCATAAPAAYALARKKVRHWEALSIYFMASTTMPVQLFLYPTYFAFARLGLIDNRFAITLIYAAMWAPFSISLLRTYVLAIPESLEEAARIDGASAWQEFWYVIFPLLRPGLITVAVIQALHSWNEFLISVTFLQSRDRMSAIASFYSLNGQYTSDWGEIMAACVMIVLPVVSMFVLLQRRFIDGMAAGAVKS